MQVPAQTPVCTLNANNRDLMIVTHLPLVPPIARGVKRRYTLHIDLDELISVGTVGLIEAVDRFDASRGACFPAFAERRIRGAIIDFVRSSGPNPRGVQERRKLIDRTHSDLLHRNHRPPEREEMAQALGMTPEKYDQFTSSSTLVQMVRLEGHADPDEPQQSIEAIPCERPSTLEQWVEHEESQALTQAMVRLPERERVVIELSFGEGARYAEIGRHLGVTESRVSQLRTQALGRLKKHVGRAMAAG